VQVADFNGDGLADLAGQANGQWWVSLSTGSAFQGATAWDDAWPTGLTWLGVRAGAFS
jgi:hypothetical protein